MTTEQTYPYVNIGPLRPSSATRSVEFALRAGRAMSTDCHDDAEMRAAVRVEIPGFDFAKVEWAGDEDVWP